jgi:gamma-glutamylcyclotransferase (GGCT)/AIG2-like uncharacterized protein YtfP
MSERRRTTGSFEVRRTTGSNEIVDRLFVYATLRQGQTARSLIANQISRSVRASTAGAIYAFPMGYAGFVETTATSRVVGELVWLTELAATFGLLDAYEGDDFARVIRQVTLETGEPVWSWIYVLSDPQAIRHGTLIEHGDWARYLREQTSQR